MFEYKCVMWLVILGVKYQAIGYSKDAPFLAARDANTKIFELTKGVPGDAPISRRGQEFYRWGKPVLPDFWINPQAHSPWAAQA